MDSNELPGPHSSYPSVDSASSQNHSRISYRQRRRSKRVSLRSGQVRIKMQMSYCWNAEWTKCQSIFFNMRYEIDADRRLLEARASAAEGRLYQQLWYLSCEISLVFFFFTSISNSLMSFTEIILKTPTVCLYFISPAHKDNKETGGIVFKYW